MTWREHAAPVIQRILVAVVGQDERVVRKALREAYPFGPRKYWPYKVWCDEVRRQRGLKRLRLRRSRRRAIDDGQGEFEFDSPRRHEGHEDGKLPAENQNRDLPE